ncbi:MAG: SRPBCC domain-containing protein [Pedobacter sp.]|jgi:uncharacterized protein YndB with AHSA1/START domain
MTEQTKIKIEAIVNAPVEKVWKLWNTPADIMKWNTADPGWHTTSSENDLRINGKFKHRMEARDGSFGFDFEGTYDNIDSYKEIGYTMPDGRTATTLFSGEADKTTLITFFDPETENDPEFQKQGWQAILNSFVMYAESENANDKSSGK